MSEGNAPKGTEAIGPKDGSYGTKVPTVHEQQAVYHAGRLRSKDHPLFSRPHLNSTTIGVRLRNTGDTAELFAAGEAHAQGESAALAAGERAEVGSVDVVDHSVRAQAVKNVHGFDARGPETATEGDFLSRPRLRLA